MIGKAHVLATSLVLGMTLGTASAQAGEYSGQVDWAGRTVLSLPVTGVVQSVNVRAGEQVARGTVLLALDPRPFEARLQQARATGDGLTRKRGEAERDVKRAQELYDRTVLSDAEREKALIVFESTDAQLRAARAAAQVSAWEKEQSVLKAPFDVRVLAVRVSPGETVVAQLDARPLIELARADRRRVLVEVEADVAARLKLDAPVKLSVSGGRQQEGVIAEIASTGEGARYRVAVEFSPEGDVVAGQPAKVVLP
ncbi:MAG: efflux RND transporter periplasmic adaptor subunit [Halothiobacillaceae bacterium]|jgi:multidrug efflux system membrane fusion protein|nr:efflux RND transporter periplasmic adaptor subunit [Halothiobacillaceae bacterium]